MSTALKLAGGFVLAAGLLAYFEIVLAVFPNPLLTTAALAPPLLIGAIALDNVRRRRASARRRGRPR